ncbi:hypothetical protein D9M71_269420 [compost metagenome]
MTHHTARLRPAPGVLVLAGQPEEALGAQQPAVVPGLVDKVEKALRMQRPARLPGSGGNAVLLGFRHMLPAQFLQPAGRLGGALEVEQTGVEDLLQRHLAHDHRHNLRLGVETAQNGTELFALGAADQVDLAQQNHVGKFHLFDQQVTDRALIFFTKGFATAGQAFGCLIITQEVQTIDHGDHGVQACLVGQTAALLITKGEGLGYRQRLGDAGGLNQQVIETPLTGQAGDLFEQVFTQGAADATVAHLHQLLFGTVEADVALDLTGIDVDFTHVVDDHRDPQVVAVFQHVIEQRAFAGTQKAGEHGDGKTVGHGGYPHQGECIRTMHCAMLYYNNTISPTHFAQNMTKGRPER